MAAKSTKTEKIILACVVGFFAWIAGRFYGNIGILAVGAFFGVLSLFIWLVMKFDQRRTPPQT